MTAAPPAQAKWSDRLADLFNSKTNRMAADQTPNSIAQFGDFINAIVFLRGAKKNTNPETYERLTLSAFLIAWWELIVVTMFTLLLVMMCLMLDNDIFESDSVHALVWVLSMFVVIAATLTALFFCATSLKSGQPFNVKGGIKTGASIVILAFCIWATVFTLDYIFDEDHYVGTPTHIQAVPNDDLATSSPEFNMDAMGKTVAYLKLSYAVNDEHDSDEHDSDDPDVYQLDHADADNRDFVVPVNMDMLRLLDHRYFSVQVPLSREHHSAYADFHGYDKLHAYSHSNPMQVMLLVFAQFAAMFIFSTTIYNHSRRSSGLINNLVRVLINKDISTAPKDVKVN